MTSVQADMEIEVWSDVVCPWCYLGKRRLERALADMGAGDEVRVTYRSFQLDPSAPIGETIETTALLTAKYGLDPQQVDAMQRQMEQRAAAEGLQYHLDGQRSGNTLDAHRLLHLARTHDLQAELLEGLFRAHFTEGRSLFDAQSLQELAVAAGLPAAAVADVLAGGRYADAVATDRDQARAYGINGVPFFVLDHRIGLSGAQPADVLRRAVEEALSTAA